VSEQKPINCYVCGDSASVELRVPFLQKLYSGQQYIAKWIELPLYLCRDDEIIYQNLRDIPRVDHYLKRTQRLNK